MKILDVGKKKSYKTISAAIKAASDGDEIIVEPGLYEECFEISKELYIHSSLDLTKAKESFSSDDIPIICIKAFETLRITAKCKIENLLFTQQKNLWFNSLSNTLYYNGFDGENTPDDLIRDFEDSEYETMVEISSDCEGKNCFFIFSAYHNVSIINGSSFFERTTFSNSYADNILICNDAVLHLKNCSVKNTMNGYGIFSCGSAKLNLMNSIFKDNTYRAIDAHENVSLLVELCKFLSSGVAINITGKSKIKISNCVIRENGGCGIYIGGNSIARVDNCQIATAKDDGENTSICLTCCENATVFMTDSICEVNASIDTSSCGLGFGDNSKATLYNCIINGCGKETAGVIAFESSNVFCYRCKFNNIVGIIVYNRSKVKLAECDSNSEGVYFKDNSKVYCYKSSISFNAYGFIDGFADNIEGNFIECEITECKQSLENYNIFLINSKFSKEVITSIKSTANVKNVSKDEIKKLYNKYFAAEIKLIKETIGIETENKIDNTNKSVDNDLFDKDSIRIIASCLSKIKKEFGIEIFSKKNLKKFINICKDFSPNKDTEIDFIKQLCEVGLLEELAKNKLKKNFYERFYNVSDSFVTRKKIASFISKFEKLFGVDIVDNK